MTLSIQAPFSVNEYTEGIVREKIEKLATYYNRIEKATVFIKKDDGHSTEGLLVEVRLAIPGPDIFAEASSDNIESAIATVSEKLRRQLIKHKEKENTKRV